MQLPAPPSPLSTTQGDNHQCENCEHCSNCNNRLMWSKLHFLDTCQSAETKAGMDRRRLIVGEINTLVKQWIKTEGVHQVSQRYFNIEVEHCKSYFAGYGLARSSKGLEARRSPTAASSWVWGREDLTLTCWLWCPGMSAGRISLRTSITTLPKSLRSLQGFCASDQVQVQGH